MSRRKDEPLPITAAANGLVQKVSRTVAKRSTPRTLYHYTSGAGLLGVLQTKSIWATNIRFMNDIREFQVALDLIADALDRRRSAGHRPSRFMSALHAVLETALETASKIDIYVSSFSEHGDQLSQWRGYCPPGNGYSLGLAPNTLTHADSGAILVSCIYSKAQHAKLIDTVIDDVVTFADTYWRGPETSDRVLRESFKLFERIVFLLGPALKDPTFSEEVEWRLVSLASSFRTEQPDFRAARSMLIPYFAHTLGAHEDVPLVAEIVVGPTPYPDLAKQAVEALLRRHGIGTASVRNSTIPFRDW
jgi:Protein of unknown function (DUF2971)